LIEKENASIALQEYLLTLEYKDKNEFLKKIEHIKNELENIEKRASTQNIVNLIDQTKINNLKEIIAIYKKSLKNS
jgi:hypothetical protein